MFGSINWIQSSLAIARLELRSTWRLLECFSVITEPFLGLIGWNRIFRQHQLAGPLWPSIESSRGTVLPNLHVDPVWSPKIAQIMLQPKLKLARKNNPSNAITNNSLILKSSLLPALLNVNFTTFGTPKCKAGSQINKFSYQLGKGMFVYQKRVKQKKRDREPSRIPKVKMLNQKKSQREMETQALLKRTVSLRTKLVIQQYTCGMT